MSDCPTSCGNCHYRHPDDRVWNQPIRCAHFNETFSEWRMDCPAWITQALIAMDECPQCHGPVHESGFCPSCKESVA